MTDTEFGDGEETHRDPADYAHPLMGPVAVASDAVDAAFDRLEDLYGEDELADLRAALHDYDAAWGRAIMYRNGEANALERVADNRLMAPVRAFGAGVVATAVIVLLTLALLKGL